MAKPFSPRLVRTSRRRTWAAWALGTMAVAVQGFLFAHIALRLGVSWEIGALVLEIAALVAWLIPAKGSGVLAVTEEAVSLDGVVLVPRREVRQADRHQSASGAAVRIRRRLATACDVTLDTDDDARELLEALSKDARHATASFLVGRGGIGLQWRIAFGGIGVMAAAVALGAALGGPHGVGQALVLVVLTALAMAVAALLTLGTIVVGADGIVVRSFLGTPRYYAHADVRDVRVDGDDVVITLASGEAIRLAVGGGAGSESVVRVSSLVERIREARARHAEGAPPGNLANVLGRGGREVGAWVSALAGVLGGASTFRTPAVPEDRLWRIVEDPAQPSPVRAGAAVALRARLDEGGRGRLRVAADACASAELREALEAAGEDDEPAIAQALAKIDPEEARRRG